MLKQQFNDFLVEKIYKWFIKNLKLANRYKYYSDDETHVQNLYDGLSKIKTGTLTFTQKQNTQELEYIEINNSKLIFLSDLLMKDSYISSIRDSISEKNEQLKDCTLLVLHTSKLDTLINTATDLSQEHYPLNYKLIYNDLLEVINTKSEFKELFRYLLKYQTNIIKEEAQSVFGYEVLYKSIINDKVDFKALELFEDFDIYKLEEDKTKIEKRIRTNDEEYRKIKNTITNFPNELEEKLPDYSPDFIKDKLTIDNWMDISFNKLLKEKENNKGQKISFDDSKKDTISSFMRDDSTSATGQRNKNIIFFTTNNNLSLFFKFKGDGIKTGEFEIKDNSNLEYSLNYSGISRELQLDISNYDFTPTFFTLKLNRIKSSETHNFKILLLKDGEFNLDDIKNSFIIRPKKKDILLQLNDFKVDFNPLKNTSIMLDEEDQEIDIEIYSKVDIEEYYNANDEVKFSIKNINSKLSFFVEGAKEEESISIPFLFNKDRLDKLFNDNEDIEFNKSKNKAIYDNREFKLVAERLTYIKYEQEFIESDKFLSKKNQDFYISDLKNIDENIYNTYKNLLAYFRENRTTPSLSSWNDNLIKLVDSFINSYLDYMEKVEENTSLNENTKILFEFGFVYRENNTFVSPFSPLILSYIVNLVKEAKKDSSYMNLSKVTIDRLNPKGLFPYLFINSDQYAFTNVVKDNSIWLKFVPNEENEFSYIKKLSYEKINEFTGSFKKLFEFRKDAPLIINSINNGENHELFEGIIKYYKDNLSTTPIKMIINLYDENYTYTSFDYFADLDKYEDIKSSFSFIKSDDDTLIDILRTHLTYSKHTIDEDQKYCHLSFFKNNEKVQVKDRTLEQTVSGLVAGGLISGESSQKENGYYYSGFGLKNIEDTEKPHIKLAKIYNSMQRAVYEEGTNYESNKTVSLMISENFKNLLTKSYENALWTIIIDPKVTLDFFDSKDDLILIHYSDQYSSSANYDAVTVTAQKELYSDVIFSDSPNINKENIIKQFNAFNGEWLIKMVTEKDNLKKERESIISAYKYITALVDTDDITWVPLSVAEMIRVSGNVGLSMADSDFSRYNELKNEQIKTSGKGAISDDILLVGLKDDSIILYPVEVKSSSADMNKAKEQVKALKRFFYEHLFEGNTLKNKLLKGLFIRQVFMQIEKYELYNIFNTNYFSEFYNKREELLEGIFELLDLDNYSKCSVIAFLDENQYDTQMSIKDDIVLEIKLPYQYQKQMIHLSYDDLKTKLYAGEYGTNPKFILKDSTIVNEPIKVIKENIDKIQLSIEKDKEVHEINLEKNRIDTTSTGIIKIKFGEDNLDKNEIFWHPANTTENQNTCTGIIGRSGTGKTQFTKSLITQLVQQSKNNIDGKKIDILIFDYKKDYIKEDFVKATNATVYDLEKLPVNPLELFGDTPRLPTHTGRTLTTTLSKAFNLGNVQRNTLKNIIQEAYKQKGIDASDKNTWSLSAPTLYNIWDIYCESEDVKQDSLYAALDDLIDFEIFESDVSKTKSLYDMINGVTVINLSGYDSNIQDLVVAILLDLFYVQMHKNGSSKVDGNTVQITKMILVDEADNFMSKDFDNLKKILKEGREFGVGTILSTQELTHFRTSEDDYASYIFTWIVHKVANLRIQDIQSIFNINNKSEAENLMSQIRELQKHYSFYVDGNKNIKKMRDLAFWELVKKGEI
ncbi:DNA phosphorothioation-dependent restriction protein DptH [Aliarcobacter butzleri]|uniref:DNA phosphorothioation-dependent restriction protein DptH n=1 Tax=Aliarcobacter butzleri TaxID=28197 RepID=UPI00263E76C4|nr:DNA phosphorothioation-dependent restriction protein DptH [Aliarcobacter butzleri]MDN5124752.1 DNA phosphorothioation-dependent restriction protein DptH [Aliarcobacter butzleri]